MVYDTLICGAGPIGCYLSNLLAKEGLNVAVVEEHESIGKPVQCTGLVSSNIFKLLSIPKNIILNELDEAKIFFADGKGYTFHHPVYVIDREKLDIFLYNESKRNGTDFFLGEKLKSFNVEKRVNSKTSRRDIESRTLVGADGPLSVVGRTIGISPHCIPGLQVRTRVKKEMIEIHFGDETAPGFFAWVVPESDEIARIGLWTNSDQRTHLRKFLKKLGIDTFIDIQAGLIPVDFLKTTSSRRVLLVGDSAAQVKATTGGGVVTGLMCADHAAYAIKKGVREGKLSREALHKNYDKRWRKDIGKELKRAYYIRKILMDFNDEDYKKLQKLVSDKNFVELLENNINLEMYSKVIPKLISHPKFLLSALDIASSKPSTLKYLLRSFF